MNQAAWLQDRRMKKFRDVLSRWEAGGLSMLEAGELLGMSERQFRRYRDRYEEDGTQGLVDRRVGKPSPKRVPAADADLMLELYGGVYRGWNVKHFHEHLVRHYGFRWGYTWVKTQLHTAGLVERAKRRGAHRRKRERKPWEGMMLHQDGSRAAWLAGRPQLDLIVTMDDATSNVYSAFLVEEWKARHRRFVRCSRCSPRTACRRASTPIAAATTSTRRRRTVRWTRTG